MHYAALLKLFVLLAIMVAMVRLKVRIGYVLMAAPFLAAGLFWRSGLPGSTWRAMTASRGEFFVKTAALLALIALIDVLGRILKQVESLPRLMDALRELFRDGRVAMAGMPAVIGFLPMPGGAMLSAPMVREMASGHEVTPEEKTLVNYWFRHVWEYFFPVYPGVVLAAEIWRIDIGDVMLRNVILTFAAIGGGCLFILVKVKPMPAEGGEKTRRLESVRAVLGGLFPIGAVLGVWFLLRLLGPGEDKVIAWKPWQSVSLVAALALVIGAMAVVFRLPRSWLLGRLRRSMPLDMAMLLVGAMLFQLVIETSGAVAQLSAELSSLGVPPVGVVAALPFVAGLLTGMTAAFVTATFPLLAGLIQAGGAGADPAATVLAYAAGYMGVMLSPVHICLVLTREYFGANLGTVYRRLLMPAAVVLAVGAAYYFVNTRL